MNMRHKFHIRAAWAVRRGGLAAVCLIAYQAHASMSVMQPWPEIDTVKALLRADALAASGGCNWDSACAPATSNSTAAAKLQRLEKIEVDAIFGVGKQLHVDISVNGKRSRYRVGRARPDSGLSISEGAYSLLAIDGGCVKLRRAETVRTVCIRAKRRAHE